MKNKLLGAFLFITGSALGFLAAHTLESRRWRHELDQMNDDLNAYLREHEHEGALTIRKQTEAALNAATDVCVEAISDMAHTLGYAETAKPAVKVRPRVISPETFGTLDDYDEITLTYYADETLTDDADRAMGEDEIEDTIGRANLKRFEQCESDAIYIRNDRLKVDYEILLDERSYAEVLRNKPYLRT